MSWVTVGVLGYVLASLAIGAWVSRRVRTEDDYLVAGRSLGYLLATFTIFATWFGAETCIGAAGSIYAEGLAGGTADPFGYSVCLFLMGAVFAGVLWRLKLTTLADVFRRRYSAGVERLAVLLMVPSSVLWAAAQIRAFGQVLHVSSGFEVTFTISLAAAVVVLYTMAGGLLADAWTDLLQGVALILGLVVLWFAVMARGGLEALAAVDPQQLGLFGGGSVAPLATLEAWAIPVCGSGLAIELVSRVIASRSATVARRSALVAGCVYLSIGAIPVTLGLVGPQLVPGLEHPEQLLPRLAETYLGPFLFTVFAGALVSAILSTVDSALLSAAALLSHNLVLPLAPGLGERARVRLARSGVAALGIVAYLLALHAEGVYALVEEASAFSSAGVFVVLLLALFTRYGGVVAAYAGLLAGALAWVSGAYWLDLEYPYLTSLAAALLAYAVGTLVQRGTGSRIALLAALAVVGSCGPRTPTAAEPDAQAVVATLGWDGVLFLEALEAAPPARGVSGS